MTAITEGMTPTQYINALNANFNALKCNTSSFLTISSSSTIANYNTNLTTVSGEIGSTISFISAGMGSGACANIENSNFTNLAAGFVIPMRDFSGLTRYASNPIVVKDSFAWNTPHIAQPQIKIENKIGNTWYAPVMGSAADYLFKNIGLLSSTDLINWTTFETPILTNVINTWEHDSLYFPCVIKIGSLWYLYYGGRNSAGKWTIGFATSPDFLTWTKYESNPVLTLADSLSCVEPFVHKIGETYYMYFDVCDGVDPTTQFVAYATSPDGINWTYIGTCLQSNATDWCAGEGLIDVWIIKRASDGIYEMTFSTAGSDQSSGYAVSKDGIHWQMKSTAILTKAAGESWDNGNVGNPTILEKPDGTCYLYYAGVHGASEYTQGGLAIIS